MGRPHFLSRGKVIGQYRPSSLAFLLAAMLVLMIPVEAQTPEQSLQETRQQAMTLEQQGNFADAETAWRAVLKTHPTSAEAYAHLGLLEARQERYKQAVPLYRKALELNPAIPGLRLNLGLALFKGGELKQALVEFQRLLKTESPGSEQSLRLTMLAGMAHYGLGEYADAAPLLREAAARDPQNLQLRLALAHSCLWSKQYDCVMETYREILTLNAESAEADMLAGEALDAQKDYDGAILQFRAAVKADPKEPEVHFGLGYILWTQKKFEEAEKEFEAELANNPRHAMTLAYLGDTEIQLNRPERAPALLNKATAIDAALELPYLDLGIMDADADRNPEALQEFQTAAKLAPDDVNVHFRLGRLYRAMGRVGEAKAEFNKTSSLHKATNDALLERMSSGRPKPADATVQPDTPAATPRD
jgi:tetratricopeptide (TPR) repeat protein